MPFERFGYLVLEQREMVCQHVVKKCRDSHFVASDYMKHLLISASFLLTLHIVVYMKYVPNIQKGKVKIHPKDDKFKIVSSKESSLETK